ncbi:uncharacterized protein LOC100833325 isoform X2 [Brachypodium distachyon]|uniref:Uncharacterized protein n=1 Tax=Brachypodium distachyon TaxID=15368 RepID=A0A2K2CSI8_BRADI|nr:uncharacterized protein LOC100833325 isoform X2 [Brachypodium distachyon]PNT64973.1 hypothetical protein BRADI_4g35291v3 [Brachypodium distachyon]|eukprot:XP_024311025.1 uncharacterized protein LOC100833325 isoform X2 [Brachypodium distachyon]
MGLLALKRFMSAQRDRRRQRIQAHDGSPASVSKRKSSPFQEDRDYEGGKRMKYLGPILPEHSFCDDGTRVCDLRACDVLLFVILLSVTFETCMLDA